MADFYKVYEEIIEPNEGGYVNDPDDKGGETFKGIARNYHPEWAGWRIVDRYKMIKGSIDKGDMIGSAALDFLVKDFYKERFWDRMQGDSIKNYYIAANLFDFYINAPGMAIKAMQEALNVYGFELVVDGKIGPKTLKAINTAPVRRLNDTFCDLRRKHYLEQAKKKSQAKFLQGWLNRVQRFENVV